MPEPVQTETVEVKAVEKTEAQEVKEQPQDLDALKRSLANKTEEADRLHKKIEKFELEAEEKRKAEMTEAQRLKEERDTFERQAKSLERAQRQRDAADKAGLPLMFAERLKGETPEELEADAKALLEAMPKAPAKQQGKIGNNAPGEKAVAGELTDDERRAFLFGSQVK